MSKPKSKKKVQRKRAPKELVAPMPKPPTDKIVVFAFRLPSGERDLIHRAAGPANATKFVKGATLAAVTADTKAFEALATQAKANLK